MAAAGSIYVEYRVRWKTSGIRPGAFRGMQSGAGERFRSSVPLHARADPRRVDVRASLRDPLGGIWVRDFEQNSALKVLVLADVSASMGFVGRHDKIEQLRMPRAPGPFARLWRSWRRRSRRALSDDDGVALLHAWHAALNLAAGEALYPSTLPHLFVTAPYLQPLRARIEELFEKSWQSFYGPVSSRAPAAEELLEVMRQAAERERGVPC